MTLTMPRIADPSRNIQAQKAAYLRAQHSMSQEEIGRVLGGISQAHVSRLLAQAEKNGWLVTELRFVKGDISAETLEDIYQLLEPPLLTKLIREIGDENGCCVPNIRVFESGSASDTNEAMELRRKRFGRVAAGRLAEMLQTSRAVGVAWGKTVSNIIEGLGSHHLHSQQEQPIQFVPACAELVGLAMPDYSSTRLVERLNDLINDGKGERLSLTGVPAYIPKRYKEAQAEMIRQYVYDISSYKKIFRDKNPLISKLDTLITSIGSPALPVGGSISELLKAGDISSRKLQSLIVGDMGGVLIPKPSLSAKEHRVIVQLNNMWTGISYEHLEKIAYDATDDTRKPGNIVVAIGKDKAPALSEIIRLGLVNELLIDKSLEQALIQTFSKKL